jgi:hypothetical protein
MTTPPALLRRQRRREMQATMPMQKTIAMTMPMIAPTARPALDETRGLLKSSVALKLQGRRTLSQDITMQPGVLRMGAFDAVIVVEEEEEVLQEL